MFRLFLLVLSFSIIGISISEEKIRIFDYEGTEIKTTYSAHTKFIGKYKGKKTGYLVLNEDGTGEYNYDMFGVAPKTCKPGVISFKWGFLIDEKNEIIRNEREYGYSYPILFKSTCDISFQGCSKAVFIDYIMEFKNGDLHVSSSDDWVKSATLN